MRTSRTRRASSALLPVAITLSLLALSSALVLPTVAAAWTPGTPLTTPFPRLAMWWPDTESASPAQLARYDWIALGPWDDPAVVARIKAQHADEIVLNATNACEIDFDPAAPASDSANTDLTAVPAAWLLTQCGATLTSPVDASTTTLHVSAVNTVAPSGSAVALFEVDDFVVLDGELAKVSAVDSAAKTLTVQRGVVKPAASHSAGTRVAATISFWPNSLMMDLTAACPRVTVDATAGPETWAEYNARVGAALATTAAWDGMLVDRSDGNESWLIGNSTARSIDGSRSNEVPADYAAFDSAWNAGLLGYEVRLRGLLGEGKLMFANWGHPNFGVLNGNNFEGFPSADPSAYPWQQTVVGPWTGRGSYFEWLAAARQPNLTTIETYEDDGGPSATSDGSYDNPAAKPGFVPNYRKMRYGLTTALLGDGFFSYEINTNGHGSLGLLWFDEYDGAGRGKGWLGTPTGAATRVGDASLGADLLGGDGGFESAEALDAWDFSTEPGAAATIARDTAEKHAGIASAHVHVSTADGTDWHVSASHAAAVSAGKSYTLTFWARADATRTVNAWIQQSADPWDNLVELGGVEVTPTWRQYELAAAASGSDAAGQLVLALGTSTGDVWVDDVRVSTGDPNVWVRRFSGGISVVNATGAPATVSLGGLYRRIFGSQAPAANSGRLAGNVTVPAYDGVVLAKPDLTRAPGLLRDLKSRCIAERTAARAIARHYAKREHRGSRSARKRATKARKAWQKVAALAATLTARTSHAQALLALASPSFADATSSLERDTAALERATRTANSAGHIARATTAIRLATIARRDVASIAVAPR